MNISSERKAGIVFHTIPEVPWQYPVVTEKSAFESLYKCPEGFDADYFGNFIQHNADCRSIIVLLPRGNNADTHGSKPMFNAGFILTLL